MNIAKALKEWRNSRGLTIEMKREGYWCSIQEKLLEAESSTTNLELVETICDMAVLTLNCIDNYNLECLIYPVKDNSGYDFYEDVTFILETDFEKAEIMTFISHLNHYTNAMGYDFIECLKETIKEISSRKVEHDLNTKKWVINITGNEYKADYTKCIKK
ncbi:hypothetical protein V2I21_01750 [Campylobacter sp. CLAX-22107-21]|uniref:hypothetical protein n=1 Tax=Campylobacter devanensis TaxID=3161138 RepID=UPI002EB03500|nr:hypothetical protein [Campylobacter sp. CLAX-22107-21]